MNDFAFHHPDDALAAWAERVAVVPPEHASSENAQTPVDQTPVGRVAAVDVLADRDSPAADVSAMDGYAVRLDDVGRGRAKLLGQCAAGSPVQHLPVDGILKIFTGAVVPVGAEAVVKVEDAVLDGDEVCFEAGTAVSNGSHIRRRGENVAAGETVVRGGECLTAASIATLANFGGLMTPVRSKVRVALITTGGEVLDVGQQPAAHQLRNSNAAAITAALANHRWIDLSPPRHCVDDRDALNDMLSDVLNDAVAACDAVVLTGGVSMGDHDYVPRCVRDVGGEIVFHKIPIRPGKPILGAVGPGGQMICGLPGNPVSAVVNTYRMAIPILRRIAGIKTWMPSNPAVSMAATSIAGGDDRTLGLHAMRLVRIDSHGRAVWVPSKGSGDLVALGQSDGFVEVPAGQSGAGPYRFWRW